MRLSDLVFFSSGAFLLFAASILYREAPHLSIGISVIVISGIIIRKLAK